MPAVTRRMACSGAAASVNGRLLIIEGSAPAPTVYVSDDGPTWQDGATRFGDVWATHDLGRTYQELPRPCWGVLPSYVATSVDGAVFVFGGEGPKVGAFAEVWSTRDNGQIWQNAWRWVLGLGMRLNMCVCGGGGGGV